MAFAEKYFIEHKTQVRGSTTTTTTTRIELHEDGFVGSATELDGRGDFWTHEYENLDPVEIFKEPVQKSRLEMHINISDATDKAILTDIFAADDDDYRLVKKVNGTIVWTGAVITDLLDYPESGYPFHGTIIAKDLTGTEGDYYTSDGTIGGSLQTGYETIITTIANLLDYTGYGLDIHTYTSWKEDNMTDSTDDFLNEVTNDIFALRDYARTGDESDEPITVFEAIKEVCRNHGLILRQANGAWRLYHRSALSDPTAVDEYIYDSTGTQTDKNTGASQVDISVSADRVVRYVLPKSRNKFNKGLKSAKVKYDHRTQISGIVYPNIIELADSSTESFSQPFISDGNQTISLSFSVHVETDVDEAEMDARVRITSGSYYLQDDLSWTTSTNSYVEFLLTKGKPLVGGGHVWRGSVSILTDSVPDAADGTLTVQFAGASGTSDFADTTEYYDINFTINNPSVDENSTFIDYELIQSGAYSGRLDYGSIWYGDGPTGYSRGALKTGSTLALESWYVKGEVPLINHAEILLREILDNQRVTTRNLRADLYGSYIADKVLVHDSTNFFFLGGQQTGKQNRWDADFIELNNQTGSDTFRKLPKFADEGDTGSSGTGGSGGGTTGVTISDGDDRWLNESENGADIPDAATFRDNIALGSTDDVTFGSVTLSDLTSGRVIYAGASGLLQDSANLTFDGNNIDLAGSFSIGTSQSRWPVLSNSRATSPEALTIQPNSGAGDMVSSLELYPSGADDRSHFVVANNSDFDNNGAVKLELDGNQASLWAYTKGTGGTLPTHFIFRAFSSGVRFEDSVLIGSNTTPTTLLNIDHTGNDPEPLIIGDLSTPTSTTGIYLRSTTSGTIRTGTGADLIFSPNLTEAGRFTGAGDFEVDNNMFVAGGLFANEFVVQQTRLLAEQIFGPMGAKIESVSGSAGSETITLSSEFGAGNPFSTGAFIKIQSRTGQSSGTIIKRLLRKVASISGQDATLTTTGVNDEDGTSYSTADDVGSIEAGDHAVGWGHATDATLDHYIHFDVANVTIPAIRFFDEVTNFDAGFEPLRVGGMAGFDASITGDIGVAGATKADGAVFWITEDEAKIGGWEFDNTKLDNNVTDVRIVLQTTSGSETIFVQNKNATGGEAKYVMLGRQFNGTSYINDFGISSVDANNNYLFRLGNTSQIAGSYFDSSDLWGGSATKANATVRLDFANGQIIYDAMGEAIYSPISTASFGAGGDASDTDANVWQDTATTGVGGATGTANRIIIKDSRYLKFGINTLRILVYTRVTGTATTLGGSVFLRFGGLEIEESFSNTTYDQKEFTLDISSLTANDFYELEVEIEARASDASDQGETCTVNARSDLFILTET